MKKTSCICGDKYSDHTNGRDCRIMGCGCLNYKKFLDDDEEEDKPKFQYQTAGEEITHRYGEHVLCNEGTIITLENIDEIINRHFAERNKKAINLAGEGLIFLAAAYRVGMVSAKDERLAITNKDWKAAQKRFLKALNI